MEDCKRNPWLGLESYREGEILYGRDDDIRDLTQSILNDIDTLLYGKSGIGKSSLLNAGVLPVVRRHGYLPVMIRLQHKVEVSYLDQIKSAVATAVEGRVTEVVAAVNPGSETLYEYLHRHTFHDADGNRVKLLVIFDQFEEIFTLQGNEKVKKAFFSQMADVLNDVMPDYMQQHGVTKADAGADVVEVSDAGSFDDIFGAINPDEVNVLPDYVADNDIRFVFTIREDFLSEFEYYTASTPSLKQNRYGLRPINEEQAAQIIERPCPGLIARDVTHLIIQKVSGRSDFELDGVPEIEVDSAVLSLYLNRLFEAKTGPVISRELVEQKGGEIINDFYLDAISGISQTSVEFIEDKLLNGQGRRDNITVYDARQSGGLTDEELDILCNRKKILRQFNYAGDLRLEFVHDILCPVVKAHRDERRQLREHQAELERQEAERAVLLAEEKRKRDELRRKAEAERVALEEKARRQKIANRRRLIVAVLALLAAVAGFGFYYWYTAWEREEFYAGFERVDGWPRGVGAPLSADARKTMPLYYRLSHKGHLDHHTDVEVRSSNGALPLQRRVALPGFPIEGTDSSALSPMLAEVSRIHFVGNENDKIDKEVYIGSADSTLFVINYFHSPNGTDAWAHFTTASGRALEVAPNGIDRMKVIWNRSSADSISADAGRVALQLYSDSREAIKPISGNVCGFAYRYNTDGSTTTYLLNEYGRADRTGSYNMEVRRVAGDTVSLRYGKVADVDAPEVMPGIGPEGYSRIEAVGDRAELYMPGSDAPVAERTIARDKRGNVLESTVRGHIPAGHPATIKYTYNPDFGYVTASERLDAAGNPFAAPGDSIYKVESTYDAEGRLTERKQYGPDRKPVHLVRIERKPGVVSETVEDYPGNYCLTKIDSTSTDGAVHSVTFYGKNGAPAMAEYDTGTSRIVCHRAVSEKIGDNRSRISFYALPQSGHAVPLPTVTDEYGQLTAYAVRETERDAFGNVLNYRIYDTAGRILRSMMYFYQNGQLIGRAVMGVDGTPVRCSDWEEEQFGFYKLYFSRNIDGDFAGIKPENEWGELGTLYDGGSKCYVKVITTDLTGREAIVGDERIAITKPYQQQAIAMDDDITDSWQPYVHILDKSSPLYVAGLRDGDRITAVGSWRAGMNQETFVREWQRTLSAPLEVKALRPLPAGFEPVSATVKRGTEDKEHIHYVRMSKDERKIYNEYIRKH